MKIGSVPRPQQVNPYAEVARKNQVSNASLQSADKVEFSESARQFKTLLRAASDVPDVRTEKVEAIRQQIESGTYKVDSKAVAEKMLESFTTKMY